MSKSILKSLVFLTTFCLGIAVFYFAYFYCVNMKPELEESNKVPLQIKSIEETSDKKDEDFDPWKLPEGFPPLKKGEFFLVGHGCGNGYVDGWLAYDGSKLSAGFNTISREEFDKEISRAGKILERVEDYPNEDGKKGLRVIVQGKNKRTGKIYYSILWFGKWHEENFGRYYLDAPNLEIALELEKWIYKENAKVK